MAQLCQPAAWSWRANVNLSGPISRRGTLAAVLAVLAILGAGLASAVGAGPDGPPLDELRLRAARRFPQPVRVGGLLGRRLLAPEPSQPVLGRAVALVGRDDGGAEVVVDLSRWPWQAARRVAVPVEAVALLGEHLALVDIPAEALRRLPALEPGSRPQLDVDSSIAVGLVKPFH